MRYSRPSRTVVHRYHHHSARYVAPGWFYYRPYYSRWWVHPYYRYTYSTVAVVSFGFAVNPWVDVWVPPVRAGWRWMPGYYAGYGWTPGYWAPVRRAPVGYVYVPGYWDGDVYVEGFNRVESRDGWNWVEGDYASEDSYERGRWEPNEQDAPEGYTWVAGFFDGEAWIDGFWRPEFRDGFAWLNGAFDEDGVFHSGYWLPFNDKPGHVWIPGWFDGNEWQKGYFEPEERYNNADVQGWEPDEGQDAGWDIEAAEPAGAAVRRYEQKETGHQPLALPVDMGD